jgi:hypothetical protein
MATRTRWNDTQLATLREMHGAAKLREIAAAVGKPLGSVQTKVRRLGLAQAKPGWTDEEETALRELVEQDVPHEEQARRLGKSPTAVSRKRQALGLVRWRQQPRHDEAAKLASLLEDVELLLRAKRPHREILDAIHEGRAALQPAAAASHEDR